MTIKTKKVELTIEEIKVLLLDEQALLHISLGLEDKTGNIRLGILKKLKDSLKKV